MEAALSRRVAVRLATCRFLNPFSMHCFKVLAFGLYHQPYEEILEPVLKERPRSRMGSAGWCCTATALYNLGLGQPIQCDLGAARVHPVTGHGLEDLSTYLCFNSLPFFIQTFRQETPHLFAHLLVSSRELLKLDAVPILRVMPLDHESFVTLAACIGGLVWEKLLRNRSPIQASSASLHQLAIGVRIP